MNNKKIKILYIHHAKGWGGAIINLINIINNLDKNKYDIKVLLLKDSIVSKKLEENNIDYFIAKSKFYKYYYQYLVHSEAGYTKWYQFYKFFRQITSWVLSRFYFAKKELQNFNPDIIHLNSSVLTDWLAPSKNKSKVIIHIQEPFRKGKLDILYVFLKKQLIKYADHIIAISKDNAKRININIENKITIIPNFFYLPKNAVNPDSYFSKKFLYLGGSMKIKGFYTLVDALNYIEKDIKFIFCGYYEYNKKKHLNFNKIIKQFNSFEKLKNNKNVKIIGLIYNTDDLFEEICCLVSPFLKPHFSRPIIEAYLNKKPVIATNVDGMEEIVFNGITGLLVPVNNPIKLAEAINFLANNPLLAKELGENGYQFAIKHFSNENIKKIEDIYEKLIYKNFYEH